MHLTILLVVLIGSLSVKVIDGCSCMMDHPQAHFCSADFTIKIKVMKKEMYPLVEPTTTVAPTTESPDDVRPTLWLEAPLAAAYMPYPRHWFTRLVYTVYVEKVYKGEEHVTAKQLVKINTYPDGAMCGLTHLTKKQRYVITGGVRGDGELWVSLCGFSNLYSNIPRRQKQGLKYHWKKDCGVCTPVNCNSYWQSCRGEDACEYRPTYDENDCDRKYARCTQDRQGNCSWFGKGDYEQCRREHPGRHFP